MADPKKFWRESIGTGVANLPRRPVAPKGPPAGGAPTGPSEPPGMKGSNGAAEVTGPVGPGRTAGPFAIETAGPVARGRSAAVEAVEQILSSLPIGSIAFTSQVAARLWPDPEPLELRLLGQLLAERYQVRSPIVREALTRTVLSRQRLRRLLRQVDDTPLETTALDARAKEWKRLSESSEELRLLLQTTPSGTGSAAISAALALLPERELLSAETALAEACAHLVAVLRGDAPREPHLDPPAVDDAVSLRGAIREGRARPGDALHLEAWAAAALARRDLLGDDRSRLEEERRILARVQQRLEAIVVRAAQSSMVDRAGAKRLLEWRRYVEEICERLDARLAPPAPPAAPAVAPAEQGADRSPKPAPEAPSVPDTSSRIFRATTKLVGLFRR